MKVDEIDFEKGGGLVPVVAQDANTGEILMLAYANKEAVEKTLQTGYAHYYSRSRKKLWMKGEESGNKQRVLKILVDCDADSLIYVVEQSGVACHTGNRSCFYRELTK
jgi:phosphoribosyl-AMP cyclohydrolase